VHIGLIIIANTEKGSCALLPHIAGDMNPADILSKHWGYQQIWPVLKPILFWQGDTMTIHHDQSPSERQGSDR